MQKVFNKKSLLLILAMALFNFVFLCTEYMFDEMMGYVTDSAGVVNAQNIVLGASVIGFVIFAKLDDMLKDVQKKVAAVLGVICVLVMLLIMIQHTSYSMIMATGVVSFVLFGIFGASVCYRMSVDRYQSHLARRIGIAYALGILIQYVNNNLIKNNIAEIVVIIVGLTILVMVAYFVEQKDFAQNLAEEDDDEDFYRVELGNKKLAVFTLTICIAFTTCIFSTLDNAVTMVHASGEFDIGQWPRLILAMSGLAAGFLFDLAQRRFMSLFMYIITLLSTICVVIIHLGGPFVIGLIVFYVSAGFFVVYFYSSFMDLSHFMNQPKLWAGLGRAVNNISAFAVSAISVELLAAESSMAILVVAIVLFALINVSALLYISMYKVNELKEKEQMKEMVNQEPENDISKLEAFLVEYGFTQREREVFEALVSSDESMQALAAKLAISRAALYRHIANMNEKTGTQNRIGLMQFYFEWMNKK